MFGIVVFVCDCVVLSFVVSCGFHGFGICSRCFGFWWFVSCWYRFGAFWGGFGGFGLFLVDGLGLGFIGSGGCCGLMQYAVLLVWGLEFDLD